MNTEGLLPYQAANAGHLLGVLQRYRAGIDASEPGTGKTYTAMGVARELGVAPLVLCPKSVRTSWRKAAAHLGGQCHPLNYEALKGEKTEWGELQRPAGYDQAEALFKAVEKQVKEFTAANEGKPIPLTLGEEIEKKRKAFKRMKSQRRFVWNTEIPLILFDESQRCKAPNSLNAKMLIAAKRQNIPLICASATPAQSPLEMRALGYVLGLHAGTDFWTWCMRHGCKKGFFGGLEFYGGAPALKKIHERIFPDRGVRTTREELGDLFPESQVSAELYDLDSGEGKIDALYAEMNEALTRLQGRTASDKDLEHPLTQLLRSRQKIELLKVPVFEDLIQIHTDHGMSVAVFVNFKETLDELAKRMEIPFAVIRGDQTESQRDAEIEKFQSGAVKLILCITSAGGVGVSLHDLHGINPRVSLISPTYSAIDLIQVLGRIWRQGAKSKALQRIVLAAGTVEEKIHRKLSRKLNNISLITDGDLQTLV